MCVCGYPIISYNHLYYILIDVGKTTINHPFENGWHPTYGEIGAGVSLFYPH